MKKTSIILLTMIMIIALTGCSNSDDIAGTSIILSTTTSTENSGLLDYILPVFEEEYDVTVKVVAVGTGKALEMGQNGEADVLLVHAKTSEEEFVAAGHGTQRHDVMYNDFIIVGPAFDGNNLEQGDNVVEGLAFINNNQLEFFSRGDDSGTHKKELSLWSEASIEPSGDWYLSVGKGMGDTIIMANERLGYTMTDRATYLSMKDNIDLEIIIEGDSVLFNQYGVIPVNPDKNDTINEAGAAAFVEWLLSEEGQKLIGSYEKYGEILFNPNAQ